MPATPPRLVLIGAFAAPSHRERGAVGIEFEFAGDEVGLR